MAEGVPHHDRQPDGSPAYRAEQDAAAARTPPGVDRFDLSPGNQALRRGRPRAHFPARGRAAEPKTVGRDVRTMSQDLRAARDDPNIVEMPQLEPHPGDTR